MSRAPGARAGLDPSADAALVVDRYLDALLAAGDRAADAVPTDADLDPALRDVGFVLRRSLVRVHPSFRFEDRLAARLSELADTRARAAAGAGAARAIPFPGPRAYPGLRLGAPRGSRLDDPLLAAILDGDLDPADAAAVARAAGVRSGTRPLIVGGAITSAAISIVGVAWVAWRASRPAGLGTNTGAMARAARIAHARRAAALVGTSAGGPA
jgi:hypothetical protein